MAFDSNEVRRVVSEPHCRRAKCGPIRVNHRCDDVRRCRDDAGVAARPSRPYSHPPLPRAKNRLLSGQGMNLDIAARSAGQPPGVPSRPRNLAALEPQIDVSELERVLRRFRRDELLDRRVPSRAAVTADVTLRFVALTGTYLIVLVAPPVVAMAAAGAFAAASLSIVGSWFHEAVHGNLQRHKRLARVSRRLGAAPFGLSSRWWIDKHVRMHQGLPRVWLTSLTPGVGREGCSHAQEVPSGVQA